MQPGSDTHEYILYIYINFEVQCYQLFTKIFSWLQIKKAEFADENFSVVVSKSANEVIATYTKDETGMDLVIRLPSSYPLRHVDVDCMRSLGISEVKQRKWLLSMMSFVRNQVFVFVVCVCVSILPERIQNLSCHLKKRVSNYIYIYIYGCIQ